MYATDLASLEVLLNANSRGLLEAIPASMLGYLLEFLPQSDPLSEWVPGHLLTPEFVLRLRDSEFTGFAHAKQHQALVGVMIFFKGRLLESWCFSGSGYETGIDAYHELLAKLSNGGVALYKLPTDAIPAVLSLTLGTIGMAAVEAKMVQGQGMIKNLGQEKFSGSLILEDGVSGQVWLYQRGQLLLSPPLPDAFRSGRLHLVHAPTRAPKDLFDALADQTRAKQHAELERIWAAALAVLTDQLGRGATQALSTQRGRIVSSDPAEVFSLLRRFFESSFEQSAVTDFEQKLGR